MGVPKASGPRLKGDVSYTTLKDAATSHQRIYPNLSGKPIRRATVTFLKILANPACVSKPKKMAVIMIAFFISMLFNC
jgi:hypothetical protein